MQAGLLPAHWFGGRAQVPLRWGPTIPHIHTGKPRPGLAENSCQRGRGRVTAAKGVCVAVLCTEAHFVHKSLARSLPEQGSGFSAIFKKTEEYGVWPGYIPNAKGGGGLPFLTYTT